MRGSIKRFPAKWEPVRRRKRVKRKKADRGRDRQWTGSYAAKLTIPSAASRPASFLRA